MKFMEKNSFTENKIKQAIKKFGYAPEHNYYWYHYSEGIGGFEEKKLKKQRNIFVLWPDGSGILTKESSEEFYIFSQPLALPEKRLEILKEYVTEVILGGRVKKVTLEIETIYYARLIKLLPMVLMALPVQYSLISPIMDFAKFDPKLPGKKFKYIRKAENKFRKTYAIEIIDAKEIPKKTLFGRIDRWKAARGGQDKAAEMGYRNIIRAGWKGTDHAHAFKVDGVIRGLNAGWRIPNSNRYYAAIGMQDYAVPDFGELLYLEDLRWMKAQGYEEADMGGGEESLTKFKNKFGPSKWYETKIFTIVKK